MKYCDLIYCVLRLNLQSLSPQWSKLSGTGGGLLARLFQGTVRGTTCTCQIATCHSAIMSLCNNDVVVISSVIFLVGGFYLISQRENQQHLLGECHGNCFMLYHVCWSALCSRESWAHSQMVSPRPNAIRKMTASARNLLCQHSAHVKAVRNQMWSKDKKTSNTECYIRIDTSWGINMCTLKRGTEQTWTQLLLKCKRTFSIESI